MHAFINSPDTVLILDEVQENKAIYERIRTFNRSLDCHVIFTGSNLKLAQDYFQPAGDCISMTMYPLSFEEYINYFGGYEYYQKIRFLRFVRKNINGFKIFIVCI